MGTRVKHMARRLAGIVAVTMVVVSCGRDAPTAARTSDAVRASGVDGSANLLGGLLGTLLSCRPMPEAQASAWIGPAGGTLRVGPHTLRVPAGALGQRVLITGIAPSDSVNLVQFYPEGLHFASPASLTMSYANCSLLVQLLPQIVYTDDGLNILEYIPSLANLLSRTVTGSVQHFSGYAVAYRR